MGIYRHLLGDPASLALFGEMYKIPTNVEVRPDGPEDGITYSDGWMPFWLVSVLEGGIRFPLHPLSGIASGSGGYAPASYCPTDIKLS